MQPMRRHVHTVPLMSAAPLVRCVQGLRTLDVDARPALAELGITHLRDLADEIPVSLFCDFWQALRRTTGESAFGIRLAQLVRLENYQLFGHLVASSATLGDSILRAVRLIRLVLETARLSFHMEGDHASLLVEPLYPEFTDREMVEFEVAVIGVVAQQITGRRLEAEQVRFSHEAPRDTRLYEELLGHRVHFGAPHNGYVFDSALLLLPLVRHDTGVVAELERQAEDLLTAERRATQLRLEVRAALAAELRGGSPTIERVAQVLSMHPKTLARRLQAEGSSFRRLLDELRLQLAERYLNQPGLTVEEVAFLLGYSEKSAFHRAFRRWTGRPPRALRDETAA
jgi:AraC-like DNA-binding protein